MLAVKMVATLDRFRALRCDWDALIAANTACSIFQTWQWLYSWWEGFGRGHELKILVATDEAGRVCGIAPLMIGRAVGVFRLRSLEFIGGHSAASEYLDFIAFPGREEAIATAFLDAIFESGDWDLLRFYQLSEASATLRLVGEQANARALHVLPIERQPSLYVPLPATWEEYMATLRPHARKNLRRYRRQIESDPEFQGVDDSSTPEAIAEFERLHHARMRDAGRVTSFESDAFRSFHAAVAARCRERGWLSVLLLRYGGRNVAALYGFALHGRWFFYNSGFDPAMASKNVSALLLSYGIERCIQAGMKEFDFLGPGEYKERWGVEERGKVSFAVTRRPAIMALQHLASGGGNLVRSGLRRAVPPTIHRFLGRQRKQILLRFNRRLR